jgi:hypothetical protein
MICLLRLRLQGQVFPILVTVQLLLTVDNRSTCIPRLTLSTTPLERFGGVEMREYTLVLYS